MDSTIARNENYQGDDENIARAQAQADGWFADIAREWREGKSTLTAEDRLGIIEISNVWDSAYDALDFESWMSIWADDRECTFASNAFGERRGIDDMRDYYMNYKKTFSGLRHVLSNDLIVGNGDTARHYCYLCIFERITGTSMLGSAVFYSQLKKVNGRWKFVRRDQVADPGMAFNPAAQALMAKFGQSDAPTQNADAATQDWTVAELEALAPDMVDMGVWESAKSEVNPIK